MRGVGVGMSACASSHRVGLSNQAGGKKKKEQHGVVQPCQTAASDRSDGLLPKSRRGCTHTTHAAVAAVASRERTPIDKLEPAPNGAETSANSAPHRRRRHVCDHNEGSPCLRSRASQDREKNAAADPHHAPAPLPPLPPLMPLLLLLRRRRQDPPPARRGGRALASPFRPRPGTPPSPSPAPRSPRACGAPRLWPSVSPPRGGWMVAFDRSIGRSEGGCVVGW